MELTKHLVCIRSNSTPNNEKGEILKGIKIDIVSQSYGDRFEVKPADIAKAISKMEPNDVILNIDYETRYFTPSPLCMYNENDSERKENVLYFVVGRFIEETDDEFVDRIKKVELNKKEHELYLRLKAKYE